MSDLRAGGCQCGRIRFEARLTSTDAYACHCRMCQRAFGSVWVAFVNLQKADVVWTTVPPELFASSPIAERGFCAGCGTSLSFWYPDSDMMDLAVAAFDDPSGFMPRHNFGVESRLENWRSFGDLPEQRADGHAPTVDRWMKAVGRVPG